MKKLLTISYICLLHVAYSQDVFVSTYAGNGTVGNVNGQVDTAKFNHPFGMCRDKNNNLYIADGGNNCIRKIDIGTGLASTWAGTGVNGWKDGPALDSAMFSGPAGVAADDSGNVYVSDFGNQRIRKISINGMVTTIAGNGTVGCMDGMADTSEFDYPRGIVVDTGGNVYVADSWNHRIRKIERTGVVSTYAGGGSTMGAGSTGALNDASDTSARFYTPSGLAIDEAGNIYVADAYNHRIRKISTDRSVTTIAGSGPTGPGNGGFFDGDSLTALFNTPTEVFVNSILHQLLVGDTYNNRVRNLNLDTHYTGTLAGSGYAGFHDDLDTFAAFNYPRGVATTTGGDEVFICDYNNNAIRSIVLFDIGAVTNITGRSINMYPNPSSNFITISGLTGQENQLQIFDLAGKEMQRIKTNNENSFTMNISSLPPAMYLIRVSDKDGNSWVQKLVKQP